MKHLFHTPILLITFNRPNHTRQVFEEIKKQKPKFLFVFQDGAREGNETDKEKCEAVRAIFEEPLDWECELHTNFSTVNLGCGPGPAAGISWFFENVEHGIIFEDDAVPAPHFFGYAAELLEQYKNESSIKVIGSMHLDGKQYGEGSYHFSMVNRNLCAWATWKRTWQAFDYNMQDVTRHDLKCSMKQYNATNKEIDYWCERLDEIQKDCLGHSSWDMQFIMSIWLHNGIGVFPNVNLSTNIGFDAEGTHTTSDVNIAANMGVNSILPLTHPKSIIISRKADLNYHKLYFQPMEYGLIGLKRWPFRINIKIKRVFGIKGSWIKK
jgi:hypothetical protein